MGVAACMGLRASDKPLLVAVMVRQHSHGGPAASLATYFSGGRVWVGMVE